ncbi:RD21L protein, partial [Baryphthengus martii]|nr:RD21L protein [Baryphthengus martii]
SAIDVAEHFTLNQSRAEDITLTEDYESNILLCDRNFGERNEEPDALRKNNFFDGSIFTSSNSLVAEHSSASLSGDKAALQEDAYCLERDCFGDEEDAADMIEILLRNEQNGLDKDILGVEEECPLSQDLVPENSTAGESAASAPSPSHGPSSNCADITMKDISHSTNETIFWLKEEGGFVLKPVDDTAVTQRKKKKRKRKLLVDTVKELSCNAIYNQLNNYTNTLAALDLAPPTKKTMLWKELGGVDQLLSSAAQPVVHTQLQMLFANCFKSHRFKMRANGMQREFEMEKTRNQQDATVEEPSYLQESLHSETERKTRDDSLAPTWRTNGHEAEDKCGETLVSKRTTELSKIVISTPWKPLQGSGGLQPCPGQPGTGLDNPKGQQIVPQLQPKPPLGQLEVASSCPAASSLGAEPNSPGSKLLNFREFGKNDEEIRWSKRTLQLLKTLQVLHLRRSGVCSVSFRELCWKNSRKEAAVKFYLILVLKKQSVIELGQSAPFADITATAGPVFDAL